jgi:hypothetical protein
MLFSKDLVFVSVIESEVLEFSSSCPPISIPRAEQQSILNLAEHPQVKPEEQVKLCSS